MEDINFTQKEFEEIYLKVIDSGKRIKIRQYFIDIAFANERPTLDELRSKYEELLMSECDTLKEVCEVLDTDISTFHRRRKKQHEQGKLIRFHSSNGVRRGAEEHSES